MTTHCAVCGVELTSGASDGPRLRLLCPSCRSAERPTTEQLAAALPKRKPEKVKKRWRPRTIARALLIVMALLLAVIRLLEK
ncbi:hypothetical protein [Chondromyces crocatus]|uniref:Uncharacterized protein n=1 Tax=Chondromyces crocatus TaxID=52 RepID=A0A0K1E7X2_CHOCO|nr:hypothetical protein [Chondromyces crocatus]AKT36959.1 uncharacterized protein CMC5_010800 [Chondromyces crocatus]